MQPRIAYNHTGKIIPVKTAHQYRENGRWYYQYGSTQVGKIYPNEMFTYIDNPSAGCYVIGFHDGRGYRTDGCIWTKNYYGWPQPYGRGHQTNGQYTMYNPNNILRGTKVNTFKLRRDTYVYDNYGRWAFTAKAGTLVGFTDGAYVYAGSSYPQRIKFDWMKQPSWGKWYQYTDCWIDTGNFQGRTGKSTVNIAWN